jgi:hypothetical protein
MSASVHQSAISISAMHQPSLSKTAVLNLFILRMSSLQHEALLKDVVPLHEVQY